MRDPAPTKRAHMKAAPDSERLYDGLAIALLVLLVASVSATFRDYGISNDEEVQHEYGRLLLNWYASGFSDTAAFSYINLYLYGGLFDMAVHLLAPVVPIDAWDLRHLLSGLAGVAGIAGAWRVARLLAGPRAGFLAAALLALTASYYGAMFNNTKDVPFAASMIWLVYCMCRIAAELPRPRLRDVALAGVVLGLALGIRVGGFLGVFYLGGAVALWLAGAALRDGLRPAAAQSLRIAWALLPAAPIAYALMALLWPWSVQHWANPVRALVEFSHFSYDIETIYDGELFKMDAVPAYYLPGYLLIKLPEIMLVGLAVAAGYAGRRALAGRSSSALQWLRAVSGRDLQLALVAMAAALPILIFVLSKPPIYNGIRHFFFVVPPLAALAAVAIDRALRDLQDRAPRTAVAAGLALVGAGAVEASTTIALHPDQYVYYNSLAGGLDDAVGRYEGDYWSNSVKEATQALARIVESENGGKAPGRTFRVALCTQRKAAEPHFPPYLKLHNDWDEADFFISPTHAGCDNELAGRIIYQAERLGAVLSVVKDRRELALIRSAATPP
ncbi:MAG: glycosyltransferase family 39 protein [Alphaproteobacteria bacterium]|nr:glycosyltransferase family 39 protein [Alphaproteobacteria bacterium]